MNYLPNRGGGTNCIKSKSPVRHDEEKSTPDFDHLREIRKPFDEVGNMLDDVGPDDPVIGGAGLDHFGKWVNLIILVIERKIYVREFTEDDIMSGAYFFLSPFVWNKST